MSENAIKKVTECTILPHHVDKVGNRLPVKGKMKLRKCMPSCNEHNNDFSDDVMCKNINNIDWSKETIRKQYLVNLKKYTTDINNLNHSTINDDKAAQLCANELNDRIIKSIHKACANITDEANIKNSVNPLKSRHTPWWTSSNYVCNVSYYYWLYL